MNQLYKISFLLFFFTAISANIFSQTTYTFNVFGSNWNVPTSWSGGVVPPDPLPATDVIIINANCTRSWYTTINGTLTINAGKTLTIDNSVEPLTFTNNGTVNNSGTIDCKGDEGFVNNSGKTITNFSGASFIVSGIGATLNNSGTFTNNLGGTVSISSNFSGMSNQSGGVITNNGTVNHFGVFHNYSGATLNNNKTFNGTAAAGAIINDSGATINLNNTSTMTAFCTFTNLGTINLVTGGSLSLTHNPVVWPAGTFNWNTGSTVTVGGTFTIASGQMITIPASSSLLRINGNPISVSSGGSLINNGTLTPGVGPFTVDNGGVLTNNATGTVTFASTILDNSGTTTNLGIFNIHLSNGQVLNNSSGVFMNSGTLNNSNLFKNNGSFTNTGTFNLNASPAILELNTNPAVFPGGTFNWNSGGHVRIGANGVMTLNNSRTVAVGRSFTVLAGGVLDVTNTGQLINSGGVYIYGTVTNAGIITTTGYLRVYTGTLSNTGTFTSSGGTTQFDNTFSNSGTLNLSSGAQMYFNYPGALYPGGTFNWTAGVFGLDAAGTMTLNNPVNTPLSGTFLTVGGSSLTNATTITNAGTFEIRGTFINNSLITNTNTFKTTSSSALTNNGTLTSNGGLVTFLQVITNTGILNLNAGTMEFGYPGITYPFTGTFNWSAGIFAIASGGSMSINSPWTVLSGRTLFVKPGGALTNTSTLTLNSSSGFTLSGTLNNNGVMINNSVISHFGGSFNNNGTLKGTGSNQGSQLFTNSASGIVSPGNSPGCYSFFNGFTNLGTVEIEINGTTFCSQFDRVDVIGTTTKGGTLALNFGFTPTLGQTFQIITSNAFAGSFASITVNPANIQVTESGGIVTVTSLIFPIELTGFSATAINKKIRLDWATASETNNKGFFIERSADGTQWDQLGFKEGYGDSRETKLYFFTDENPLSGRNYYRLTQVDFDGRATQSPIVSATLNDLSDKQIVYPNPVAAGVEWSLNPDVFDEDAVVSLRILDVTGRQVALFSNSLQLQTPNLIPGIYWLEVQSDLGYFVEKVLVR